MKKNLCLAIAFKEELNLTIKTIALGRNNNESDRSNILSRGEQATPPSTDRRKQGEGTGYIECKPIKRGGKEYKQYWYHYEEWQSGDRVSKKSIYIHKKMRSQVEKMNGDKVPVEDILKILSKKRLNH